jgi:predicted negative regulator of RcsB-dependent stress response
LARYKRIKKKSSLKSPDEFLSFWSRTYNWLAENRDRLLAPLLIVLLVIVMAGGLFYYRQQKGLTAQREFSNIMKIYPRGAESTSAELEKAARSLADFSERFSGTSAARVAELYRAHSLARQAKTVEAEKVYREILDSGGGDELVKEMAALSLERLYQDQGKYEESSGVLKKNTKEK